MRMLGTLFLASLLLAAPLAQANEEDGGVVVRAKPGLDLEALARRLLGSDEGLARAAAKLARNLQPQQLEDLLKSVRRVALAGAGRSTAPEPSATGSDGDRPLLIVEARVIEAPRDVLVERPTAQHPVRFLDEAQATSLLRQIEEQEQVQVLSAPRLSTFDGQRANISILNQISYVQDYEVEVGATTTVSDPVVGVVQEGLVLDLRPVLSQDQKVITIELEGTWSKVARPIPEMEVEVAPGLPKVKIQLPVVTSTKLRAHATVKPGTHVLVGGGPLFQRKGKAHQRLILLRADKVETAK